jgi:hypothetical protein
MPDTRMNKHVAMISHPAGLAWSRTSGSDRIVASNKVGILRLSGYIKWVSPPVCLVFLRAVRATFTDRGQADANGDELCTTAGWAQGGGGAARLPVGPPAPTPQPSDGSCVSHSHTRNGPGQAQGHAHPPT